MSADLRLAVLNASGRDPEQSFAEGPGGPGERGHPPVNFHAYAACTRGSFHRETDAALATGRPVLLLLRRDLRAGLRALQRLKAAGRPVTVTFKEAGAVQLAARLTHPADLPRLAEITALADGCLAPTPWLAAFLADVAPAGKSVALIPTPYPLTDPRWNFAQPPGERCGIFVGTREFATPARQHLAAMLASRRLSEQTGEPVTVFNTDGRRGAKMLAALGFPKGRLRIHSKPLPYSDYLREVARHKLVWQLDGSEVPGQVAGDALLCGVPCVGGNGAIERLAFPAWCGVGREAGELSEIAHTLLTNLSAHEHACQESQVRARKSVSYDTVAGQLAAFYKGLA